MVHRKCSFQILILMIVFAFASADEAPAPDIREQSVQEYIESAEACFDRKILFSLYIDAMKVELDDLAARINIALSEVPSLQESFREAHEDFTACCHSRAALGEDIQWYNLETGESYFGSGYGYTRMSIIASMYWEQTGVYRHILETASEDPFIYESFVVLPDSLIGGY